MNHDDGLGKNLILYSCRTHSKHRIIIHVPLYTVCTDTGQNLVVSPSS